MSDQVSTPPATTPEPPTEEQSTVDPLSTVSRDIAEVPSVEIISTAALHLMSAAAVHLGLAEDLPEHRDLDEARSLIDSLAGLLDAAAPSLGHHHAAPLRDGLRSLQLAFQEASTIPDEPGTGPGEKYTGAVHPAARPQYTRPLPVEDVPTDR
ncbi:DUF1844 domain-containing protein [Kribbella sp. NPDC051718]|uniref:DUF1844 domain-containing protein n=1 Tax=Kribbella sp. NPDC051718 TaxID=3155168 RepID=UPI0034383F53